MAGHPAKDCSAFNERERKKEKERQWEGDGESLGGGPSAGLEDEELKREWGTCSAGEREADRERAGLRTYREKNTPLITTLHTLLSHRQDEQHVLVEPAQDAVCAVSECVSSTGL